MCGWTFLLLRKSKNLLILLKIDQNKTSNIRERERKKKIEEKKAKTKINKYIYSLNKYFALYILKIIFSMYIQRSDTFLLEKFLFFFILLLLLLL